jgi:hypothetical protein
MHCNDLTVIVLNIYKAAAVLLALMKMCIIPCHDRGHINVMLVLQSSTDSLHIKEEEIPEDINCPDIKSEPASLWL